ncbi:hypothetical protein FA743_10995 [Paracoccus gahaiensis]|uniref:Uncharacterized protein n=1 Tax=Paracoccus gahaiensis TaxID=1706839 RepID=A0A4U0R987_9RHOB|nr:hypothetical protein [Paracoccus gahaiensis]TJZ91615.1 hypothetical protein FA743_10995 [Paracoccus gahaiensis]
MNQNQFFEQEFSRFRLEYEGGNPVALNEAVLLAIWNNVPVPEWAVPGLESMVTMHAEGRFERRQGVAAPLVIEARARQAAAIYQKVEWLLRLDEASWSFYSTGTRQSKTEAFTVASELFQEAGKQYGDRAKAHMNPDTVKNAYYAVQRAVRSGNAHKFGLCKKSGDF